MANSAQKSGLRYAGDWAIEHWPSLVISVSGLAVTVVAALSKILRPYGALGWIAAGLLTLLVLSLIYALYGWASDKRAAAIYKRSILAIPVSVNPLRSNFEGERVRVADFHSPFDSTHTNKTFRRCDIVGPGAIVLLGNTQMFDFKFFACDLVAMKAGNLATAAGFERSTFDTCRFFNVTIFLSEDTAKSLLAGQDPAHPLQIVGLNA